MTTWTAPPTFTAGAILTKAQLDTNVRDNPNYLFEVIHGTNADKIPFAAHDNAAWVVPQARVDIVSSWVLANNTATQIAFILERWDTDTIHDAAVNTSRLTCKTKGIYLIYGHVEFPASATGQRRVRILAGGTSVYAQQALPADSANAQAFSIATMLQMNVNDYVELDVFQNSGGSLTMGATSAYGTEFGMTWVGGF